jgi:hypothetical protein
VNHVPNDVLAALDEFGRGLLVDEPAVVRGRLRSDFEVRIDVDRTALDTGVATIAFRLEHTAAADELRDHGTYVRTIVDNLETRLREWGVDTPPAYAHRTTENGWQMYEGTLEL